MCDATLPYKSITDGEKKIRDFLERDHAPLDWACGYAYQ
jgi:hypothetical protein